MGKGQSTISKNKDITNTQTFKNTVKKSLTALNKMHTELIQKQCTTVSSSNIINQKIEIKGVKTKDFEIDDLEIKADTKFNMSVLANSKMRNDMINKVTQKIKDGIEHMTTSTEKQMQSEGEPVFADAIGGLTDVLDSAVTGLSGSKHTLNQNTTVANIVNLNNKTDLKQKIESSVDTKLVNTIVNDLKNSLLVNQGVNIQDIEASDKFHISKINMSFLTSVVQDTVSKSDLSSKIISTFAGTSVSTVKTAAEADQDQKTEQKTAIDDAGDAIAKDVTAVGDATAKNIDAAGDAGAKLALATLLPFVIGGVIFLIIIVVLIWAFGSSSTGAIKKASRYTPIGMAVNKLTKDEKKNPVQKGEGPINNFVFGEQTSDTVIRVILIMIIAIILYFHISLENKKKQEQKKMIDANLTPHIVHVSLYNPSLKRRFYFENKFLSKYNWPLYITNSKNMAQSVRYAIDPDVDKMYVFKIVNDVPFFLFYTSMFNRFAFEEYQEGRRNMYYMDYEKVEGGYLLSFNNTYMTFCDQRSIVGTNKKDVSLLHLHFIPT